MINNVSVIGTGVMGKGIAFVCAAGGLRVSVYDKYAEGLKTCKEYITAFTERKVNKGLMSGYEAKATSERVVYHKELKSAVIEADLVIEAVPEVMDLKIKMFQEMDQLAPAHAILATNTSTMSPTEISAQTNRPEQCIALHFFNPVPKMKLIEVICGLETSQETIDGSFEFGRQINKECVKINEFPGFAVSRMNCLIGNEAMNMLMEGVGSVEDIDKAMNLGLNHPMGPLELADLVGLDTRLHNMEYLYQTLGEKYRPCPILTKYVKAGHLGRKTGKGFYTYS